MWSVEFIPGETIEIHAPVRHVDGAVGRVGDGVDAEEGAGDGVDDRGESFDVVDGAEDVGGVSAGDEFSFGAHQIPQGVRVELRVEFVRGGPPDQAAFSVEGELDPGGDIGFVVEEGDDDFVVGSDVVVQCLGKVTEQLRRGRPDYDAVGCRIDVSCNGLLACFEQVTRCFANRIAGTQLHIVVAQIVDNRVNDLFQNLTATRIVEILPWA